jgi:phospholipid transport system substrate-binding protein
MVDYLTRCANLAARARIAILLVALACWPLIVSAQAGPASADADVATGSVAAFHQALVDALAIDQHAAREALLLPQVEQRFDVRRIAAISLGRTWRSLSESQQNVFVDLLTTLIAATYADRFDGFNGQRFVSEATAAVKSGFIVKTRLQRSTGEDVSLHYFLRDGRIFNVVADSVSDLSLRRADYNSIIKNQGYAALVAHIEEKIVLARSTQ